MTYSFLFLYCSSESGVDQFSLPNGSGPLLSYVRLADENYTKSSKSSDSVGYLSGLPAKLTPS